MPWLNLSCLRLAGWLAAFLPACRRGVQLHILSPGMEKRRTNTTRYDGRMQLLHWHVELPLCGRVHIERRHQMRVLLGLVPDTLCIVTFF